jgi:xeroderma pigmentosum group C-complementing protein
MLPKGTVHIPINGLQRTLRKLNIDAAPAMMGWDFSGRGCHPVFDGYVVCQEFEDLVLDAWNKDQQERVSEIPSVNLVVTNGQPP